MNCPTCGDELKVIVVQVPVASRYDEQSEPSHEWEEEEQVCDCPRCQGAY